MNIAIFILKLKTYCNIENNIRVTDAETLIAVKDATGSMRLHIEALLTMGLVNSPMHGSQIRVSTGNFVIAKPIEAPFHLEA